MTATAEGRSAGQHQRRDVPVERTWELSAIFADWATWQEACRTFEAGLARYAALEGTLASGPEALLAALRLADELGQLAYPIWYYPSLKHDEDQRDDAVRARRQQAQTLLARWEQASAWFAPELMALAEEQVSGWSEGEAFAPYRFKVRDLLRRRAHVLSPEGERVLALGALFSELPGEAYAALTTADIRYPALELSDGRSLTLTYGQYRRVLHTCRVQRDRAEAFRLFHETFQAHLNTYAAFYDGVCQRDWFAARARRYDSTLEAALHPHAIPVAVVENLTAATRAGLAPLRRYHRLRQRVLGLDSYHLFDGAIPLADSDPHYPYEAAADLVQGALAGLGPEVAAIVERAFGERWIDVHESEGKRAGAYSAGVWGVHPYMLLNYHDTLDDLFTLAHEMGHTVHTVLAHGAQPFATSSYTIFVAEVASTLAESLLLDHLLTRTDDAEERIHLLQHAIDAILGTFYSQVLFAEWELAAHRRVEAGEPITAEALSTLYRDLLAGYYGDAVALEPLYGITWARIPHFFQSPYYVYQYATSLAASASLAEELRGAADPDARRAVVERVLSLLRAGGDDHPVVQLRGAGVDLTAPQTVRAVAQRLDDLVGALERALAAPGRP